ncbi:MAG: hypothetical protein ACOYOA_13625 [Saprospiraceae bacterium]
MEIKFDDFLKFFPEIQLPVTLREDTFEEFSRELPPLPVAMIEHYLMEDDEEDDGMTEYISCFRLPNTENFKALVYWKAGLLSYEYVLKTYTNDGLAVIDSYAIAGTTVNGTQIVQSIGMIAADMTVYIATGEMADDEFQLDASKNRVQTVELLENGMLEL